jgi:hypothetical protein
MGGGGGREANELLHCSSLLSSCYLLLIVKNHTNTDVLCYVGRGEGAWVEEEQKKKRVYILSSFEELGLN